jgi:hypothetical protein
LQSDLNVSMATELGAFLSLKNFTIVETYPAPMSDLLNSEEAPGCIRYILYMSIHGNTFGVGNAKSYSIV